MRRRVVITGMGAVTPLGNTVADFFRAVVAGDNGVGPITHFDASTFPTKLAAEVRDFDLTRLWPRKLPEHAVHWGSNTRFAAVASLEAFAQAGHPTWSRSDADRFGIYVGVGEGRQEFHRMFWSIARSWSGETRKLDTRLFARHGQQVLDPGEEMEKELHTPIGRLAALFDLRGPHYSCLTACAAGSQAIGEAAHLIRQGDADLMLTGGTHSMIHPLGVSGFIRLSALSPNPDPESASRPFDRNRDGFVVGEGAGILVLEELEHAKRRGATIHAELTGYGSTADAYRVTDSHPEGRGAIACMQQALADAGLAPGDIGYINAHGTSTKVNDSSESVAIQQVFAGKPPPASSTKSMIGHLIGAAGAVELIVCVEAIRKGVLPPTIHYATPDPDCELDVIPDRARECRIRHALSNSFGFGGQDVSLVVSRFDG